MAINYRQPDLPSRFETFCDWGMVYSLSACIFVLPAAIAYLDSFAALAILFFLVKRIYRINHGWQLQPQGTNTFNRIIAGFGPAVNIVNRPLLWLTLAFFISTVLSRYPGLSFSAFFGKYVKCVFLYFVCVEAFTDKRRISIFLSWLLFSALIVALSGIYQHYSGIDFLKAHFIGMENGIKSNRVSSCFSSANGLGAYLLPVIALVAHFSYTAITKKSWALASLLIVFLGILMFCLCWTFSRSSWLGFLIVAVVMVCMDWRKFVLAAVLFILFIAFFLPALSNARHVLLLSDNTTRSTQNRLDLYELGGSGRFAFWQKAVSIIRTSPVWGSGLNTYGRILRETSQPKDRWYAHNCYLQLWAETGILGLSCFIWMLSVFLRHGFLSLHRIKDHWPLAVLQGSLAGLCGLLVQSFFDNTFITVQLSMLMWMMFGVLVAASVLKEGV